MSLQFVRLLLAYAPTSVSASCSEVTLRCAGESSSWSDSWTCSKSVDNDVSRYGWWAESGFNTNQWLKYETDEAMTIESIFLYGDDYMGGANWAPKTMQLQKCSDEDCSEYVTIAEWPVKKCLFWQGFDCDSACKESLGAVSQVRLFFPDGHGSTMALREIKMCSTECPYCMKSWVQCDPNNTEIACDGMCGSGCSCGCPEENDYGATCTWVGPEDRQYYYYPDASLPALMPVAIASMWL